MTNERKFEIIEIETGNTVVVVDEKYAMWFMNQVFQNGQSGKYAVRAL